MHTRTIVAATILLAVIPATAGTTMPYLESTAPASTDAPAWHWRATLYGWAEALDGDVTVRGRTADVDLGFDDVLDNLDFAMMGAVEAGYGKWSLIADLSYAELSGSRNTRLRTTRVELDQLIGNFVVAYNLMDTADRRFDVYAGARVNSLDIDIDITLGQVNAASLSDRKTWVDPIIGVRFQTDLSEKFFFRAVGDIGGFNVSSDFTWQAMGLLGYRVSENGSVLLGYRGIGTDYSDGDFGYDVTSHGFIVGFGYSF